MNIQITELTRKEAIKLSKDLADFNPVKCYNCGNKKKIIQRFFLLNSPASEENHEKIKRALIKKFGLTYYGFDNEEDKVITSAKCPDCDGEKMEWEY